MLKKILTALVLLVLGVIALAATKPDEFRVERSTVISAPAAKIFALVNNQSKWDSWSPWAKLDPNAKFTYEGPKAGVGAIARWEGNMEVGKGSSTIIESRPNELITFTLEFLEPMSGTSTVDFTFKPEGKDTRVTWLMYGPANLVSKVMGLLMNCEKMVGEQFDQGLANLKVVAEKK